MFYLTAGESVGEVAEKLTESDTWANVLSTVTNWLTSTGIKVLISVIILIISFKLANFLFRKLAKKLDKNEKADKTLTKTLVHAGLIIVKVLIVVAIIGYLGIDTSGISALIASLGVCVGLAVNGTLSNLAGGVMLLLTRPFRVDDYIEACGYAGVVEEIGIVATKVCTLDNKVVYIPNGTLSTSSIVNYSVKDLRRVDLVFSVAYENDFDQAKQIILDKCNKHELVLKNPEPFVRVSGHGESSIEITTRAWTKNADYWTVYFDLVESVKKAFDANGIQIPYKQVDVHVKNDK